MSQIMLSPDLDFWNKIATFTAEAQETEVDSGGIMEGVLTHFKEAGFDPFWTVGFLQKVAEFGGMEKVAVQAPNAYFPQYTPGPAATPSGKGLGQSIKETISDILPGGKERRIVATQKAVGNFTKSISDTINSGRKAIGNIYDKNIQPAVDKVKEVAGNAYDKTLKPGVDAVVEQGKDLTRPGGVGRFGEKLEDNAILNTLNRNDSGSFAQQAGIGALNMISNDPREKIKFVKDWRKGDYGEIAKGLINNPTVRSWGSALLPAIGTFAASKLMGADTMPALALGAGAGFVGNQAYQHGGLQNAWNAWTGPAQQTKPAPAPGAAPGVVDAQQATAGAAQHNKEIQESVRPKI